MVSLVSTAVADPQTVTIAGIARDSESGAPVASAIISLPGLGRSVLTDPDGRYTLHAFPGTRRVTVQRIGYAAQEFDALVPESGSLEINIDMRCVPIVLPPIEVRSRVPMRGLERENTLNFPDRSISRDALYQDPLLSEPDFLRALGGGEVVVEPESPSGLHIRGGASDQVAYLVDGIPVFSPYHAASTFSAWNPDAMSGVDLVASSTMPDAPDALSGVVSANTRTPGSEIHSSGSVSATQARATVDGPLGKTNAGYLLSVGSAFPGLLVHKSEASHLNGETLDWLGKIESPLFSGRVRLLGYASQNELDAAAVAQTGDAVVTDPSRNHFAWHSHSAGVEWARALGDATLLLRSWSAYGEADVSWASPDSTEAVASSRRDDGLVAIVSFPLSRGRSSLGARLQNSHSFYGFHSMGKAPFSLDVTTPLSTVFVEHGRAITKRTSLSLSLANTFFANDYYLSPGAQLRWQTNPQTTFSVTAARRHQFGQSLRNAESVVSAVFPADLYVGAGDKGVPVASSNIGILAVEHRPNETLRFGWQGYMRDFGGLALVAPHGATPFATDGFTVGSGTAYGFAIDAGMSHNHYGLLASYGFQQVTIAYPGGEYAPGYGALHSFEAGVVYLPAPTYSVRLGFQSVLGRRTTSVLGSLEYEAVNLLDQGAEFAGSPGEWSEALGASTLPAYYRFDIGFRKQWRTRFANHDGLLAVFGTVSNLMDRSNVLTETVDAATGARTPIEMRPFSPLVIGLDWRF